MSEFTPGPWIVDAPGMVATKATGADGWEICDIRDDVPGCAANARLIAAAPDLLEVLEQVCRIWDHHCDAHGDGAPSEAHARVRAAIAKAKGQPC